MGENAIAFNVPNLNWYYGLGGHVSDYGDNFDGTWRPAWYHHPHGDDNGDLGLGVDGIVGLEYKIPRIPFAVSLDFKPYLEAITDGGLFFWIDPGLGIKLAF